MTWLWRICSSVLAVPVLAVPVLAGVVTGRVTLRDSREAAVRKQANFSGVIVALEAVGRAAPAAGPARARMVQKDKRFVPHVLAVTAGTTVDFPNYDPIFHNAFSNYDGQIFDVGLYAPGTSRSVRFSRPGIVRVFCNIHAEMSAVIVVLPTPWFDATRADGVFEIRGVPAGEYTLRIFHERATPATLNSLERVVSVGDVPVALPAVSISESGYLPIPHKNKYNKDYPPAPDDAGLYPGVRK